MAQPDYDRPTPAEIASLLEKSLSDGELSRNERKGFRALLSSLELGSSDLNLLRQRAFAMARTATRDGRAPLDWLEEVIAVLDEARSGDGSPSVEAMFSPGEGCRLALGERFGRARTSVDVCVYTITDDALTDAIIAAHRRGVRVRVVSDNEKAEDVGSDILGLRRAGIPVAVDTSTAHMHNKFAIFDEAWLLTGSYNWTRSAFLENQENLVALRDKHAIAQFQAVFDTLWSRWYDK